MNHRNRSVDAAICEARGITQEQLAEMRAARVFDERTAAAPQPTGQVERRSLTDAEVRDIAAKFHATERVAETHSARDPQEARFKDWLRSGHGWSYQEQRAAGEGTAGAGGDLVPTRWNAALIRQLREYSGILHAFEQWGSPNGDPVDRPSVVPQAAASAQTENTAIVDGPYMTLGQQAWGQTPTYAASARVSNQLVQDAYNLPAVNPDGGSLGLPRQDIGDSWGMPGGAPVRQGPRNQPLEAVVRSLLAESLGRVIAPVASTALYAAITAVGAASGQDGGYLALSAATPINYITGSASTELIQNTINIDTALQMIAAIDVAYLDGAKFYFSSQQWTNLIRQVDSNKHLQAEPSLGLKIADFPVVLTSQTSTATASTVSGPVFGNLGAAMTLRIAGGSDATMVFRSSEKYAEYLQTFYRVGLRADFAARDSRAVVGVKYAST